MTNTIQSTKEAREELAASGVAKHTIDALYPTALQEMVRKLDEVKPGFNGYIACNPEIVSILSELSKSISANVIASDYSTDPELNAKVLSVEIKFSFAIERDEL